MQDQDQRPVTAEISDDGGRVNVVFAYNPAFVQAVKSVPTRRFVPKEKGGPFWRVDLDLATMRRLREAFGDKLGLGPNLIEWGREQVSKERNLSDLSQADDAELENIPESMLKGCEGITLRPYQKADIKFMATTSTINANQPGAGKTLETIGAIFEAGLEWGQHLVSAPVTSLREVWVKEITFAYNCAGFDEPTILTGDTPDQRREAIAEAKRMSDEGLAFWLVINPAMLRNETIWTKADGEVVSREQIEELTANQRDLLKTAEQLVYPELAEIDWDTFTIDEFHLMGLSNPDTLGHRGAMDIAEATKPVRKYALSGTPMQGKPIKLWGALRFLDSQNFSSKWNWARHWLVINSNDFGKSIEGIMPGREMDFYNHLKPYLVRRTKREALPGLPPKQHIDVWCPMTAKQREQYTTMATEAEWAMQDQEDEGRLTVTNILAMYTRLKQFSDAYCDVTRSAIVDKTTGLSKMDVRPTRESGKIDRLMEKLAEENVFADEGDEPKAALVFSQFNGVVAAAAEAIEQKGVKVGRIDGSVTGKKRADIVREFTEGGPDAPRVLVLNTMAGGASINLSRADTVHILDETWVPDHQEQAEDRAHRGDARTMEKDEVRMYYYRTRDSIEEEIQKLVADKQMNNKTILDLRRRMAKQQAEVDAASE